MKNEILGKHQYDESELCIRKFATGECVNGVTSFNYSVTIACS